MSANHRARSRRSEAGFTLMEVLAAVFLTTIVITAAISFYINLSDSATRATQMMRQQLHAAAVLDRLSRDLGAASLVTKKEEVDPLSHPWYFVADSLHAGDGADRVKFLGRSQKPRANAVHGSDLAQIAYFTERQEDDTLTLFRWLAYGLPAQYPIEFPDSDDERSLVLAEGIESFSMRFLGEDGEWAEEWDSTQLIRASQLPIAVEFAVVLHEERDAQAPIDIDDTPEVFARSVLLASRPIDLAGLIKEKQTLMAQIEQNAIARGVSETPGTAGDGTVSCLDLCLSQRPEAFCRQLLDLAADSPDAQSFRAEFNCQ